jgi:predicted nucleotidyltransferase
MSDFRLLIDIEVLDFLQTLRRREQEELLKRFREIATFPTKFSDFAEKDGSGRPIDVHISGKFAIKFWNDFADRQIKILDVHPADLSS